MSQHHQVRMIHVDATQHDQIRLDELFGQIPQAELLEVLQSEWARREGWQCQEGSAETFVCRLSNGVAVTFQVGDDGYIAVDWKASEQVREDQAAGKRQGLEHLVAASREEVNLRVHEVIGRAMVLALPRVAREAGYEVISHEETYDEESVAVDMEMAVQIYETV